MRLPKSRCRAGLSRSPWDIPATWGGSLLGRPRLTGSWFGLRDDFGENGVELDIDLLQIGDCSPGKAGGINVSRSKRLDGDASRPLAPPYGGLNFS